MIDLINSIDVGTLLTLVATLIVTGGIAGILSGMLGVGGGIVIVPVLYHLFDLLHIDESVALHTAVGTSLATIIATGFISARSHYRQQAVDMLLLRSWGPAIAVGVILGSLVSGLLSGQILVAVFASVALLVALHMAFIKDAIIISQSLPATPIKQAIAIVIGGISVMMGIGGGTLSVPILSAFNYPVRRAVATASAIGLIIAIPGCIAAIYFGMNVEGRPPLSIGYVNLLGLMMIIPTSMLCAPLGVRIAHYIQPTTLRKVFALFLLLTSIKMFQGLFG